MPRLRGDAPCWLISPLWSTIRRWWFTRKTVLHPVFAAHPRDQIAGVELAEFEESRDEAENEKALAIILDRVGPLLAAAP